MAERKRIDVTIDGRNFAIVGSEDEEYIADLAHYVDRKIKNLNSKNDKLSQIMSATLAALHIADELYKTSESYSQLEEQAKEPLEKYDDLCEKLKEAEARIESYEKTFSDYERKLGDQGREKEKVASKIEEYERLLEDKDKKIEGLKEEIQDLKDKNFENQLELVDTKKELSDYLRILEKETSIN